MVSDKDIIEQIVAGDTEKFREIVERYQRLVGHIVFRLITNPIEREEIMQEVFVKAYQNLPKFEFKSKFSTWLSKIAYHTCLNHLKKHKVPLFEAFQNIGNEKSGEEQEASLLARVAASDSTPEESLLQKNLQSIVLKEIEALPIPYRLIVTLYHLENFSYKEIAQVTGFPEGTVKSYLHRARAYLKQQLLRKFSQEELFQ